VCCSVLQCVAVCCSVLQCAAACCSMLQCCSMVQYTAVCYIVFCPMCDVLERWIEGVCATHIHTYTPAHMHTHTHTHKHTQRDVPLFTNAYHTCKLNTYIVQHTATHCDTLQRTAAHCNTVLQCVARVSYV